MGFPRKRALSAGGIELFGCRGARALGGSLYYFVPFIFSGALPAAAGSAALRLLGLQFSVGLYGLHHHAAALYAHHPHLLATLQILAVRHHVQLHAVKIRHARRAQHREGNAVLPHEELQVVA